MLKTRATSPAAVAADPTKEIFVPTTIGVEGALQSRRGYHGGYLVEGSNHLAITEFHVPHDFTAIDELVIVFIPLETLTPMDFYLRINAAANGEAYNAHTEVWDVARNTVAFTVQEIDISTIIPFISAGDYVGVGFFCDLGANTNALVLGVRLKYT